MAISSKRHGKQQPTNNNAPKQQPVLCYISEPEHLFHFTIITQHNSVPTNMFQYYDPETTCNYQTPDEMKRVWDVQLDLASKFSEVCQRHGLRFWLDGGTLLGAVRHKGFIPWDDDIDLIMMRDDYDRLNRIASEEFTEPYFWQTTYSDTGFFCGHAMLRNTQTTCIGPDEHDAPYCRGISIDIFVLDGVPDNPVAYALHRLAAKAINQATRFSIRKNMSKKVQKWLFGCYEGLFRMNSVNRSRHIGLISWRYRHHEVLDKSYYDQTVMLEFAGKQFPAPAMYHQLLSNYYGNDYMTPKQLPTFHGKKQFDPYHPLAL